MLSAEVEASKKKLLECLEKKSFRDVYQLWDKLNEPLVENNCFMKNVEEEEEGVYSVTIQSYREENKLPEVKAVIDTNFQLFYVDLNGKIVTDKSLERSRRMELDAADGFLKNVQMYVYSVIF